MLIVCYRVGTELIIRLKWGQTEYRGKLESIDSYMNVLLRETEEFIDGKNTGSLGLVLIRCVLPLNLLYDLRVFEILAIEREVVVANSNCDWLDVTIFSGWLAQMVWTWPI